MNLATHRQLDVGATPEQAQERFDTEGVDFGTALARVVAGGPDDGDHKAEREAEK